LKWPATLVFAGCSAGIRVSQEHQHHQSQGVAKQEHKVYVCHGDKKSRWLEVASSSTDAHAKHGDRISSRIEVAGETCSK
jgi:hypothetical protein